MIIDNSEPIVKVMNSVEDTVNLAADIADILEMGDIILFSGVIGGGKTTFIQALAKKLGIKELVTSPTFVIHVLHDSGRILLSHVDLYRLEDDDEEIDAIGFEEYYDHAITVIEWADRYSGFEPPFLKMHFGYGATENERIITITATGGNWTERLNKIFDK